MSNFQISDDDEEVEPIIFHPALQGINKFFMEI